MENNTTNEVTNYIIPSFPPVLDIDLLGKLIFKAPGTIRNTLNLSPESLPPTRVVGGKLVWMTDEVLDWVRNAPLRNPGSAKPKMGAPTKAERVAKLKSQAISA